MQAVPIPWRTGPVANRLPWPPAVHPNALQAMFQVTVWNVQPAIFTSAVDGKYFEVAINDLIVMRDEFNLSRLLR